jgi:hypothetical protein
MLQDEALAAIARLNESGTMLGRPWADTLKGSRFSNMKELRLSVADGAWRLAFAFDPGRRAVVLCGGNKVGANEQRFYRALIDKADRRFAEWLKELDR